MTKLVHLTGEIKELPVGERLESKTRIIAGEIGTDGDIHPASPWRFVKGASFFLSTATGNLITVLDSIKKWLDEPRTLSVSHYMLRYLLVLNSSGDSVNADDLVLSLGSATGGYNTLRLDKYGLYVAASRGPSWHELPLADSTGSLKANFVDWAAAEVHTAVLYIEAYRRYSDVDDIEAVSS